MTTPEPEKSGTRRRPAAAAPAKPVSAGKPTTVEPSLAAAPRYLVIFPEPSEDNAECVAKVMSGSLDESAKRPGIAMLRSRGPGQAATRVFQRLGIAAADLTNEEVIRFTAMEGVQVVANRTRRIPPIVMSDPDDRAVEQGRSVDAEAIAYLTGARDALDLALRHLGGATFLAQTPPSIAALAATSNWCLTAIGLEGATRTLTGKGVKVAVLDTGIDLEHPDLKDRIGATQSFVAGESVQDEHGHGTHCAGVIAGSLQTRGRFPYSTAPGAELLVGKVLNRQGNGTDDQILEAMTWAVDNGAHVISMSLGSDREEGEPYATAYETVARTLLREGVLVVAAAGNESNRPHFTRPVGNPAACPSILAVAAIDRALRVASFSCRKMDNIGEVNISGPGVGVYSAWIGGGHKSISGTSMATPHVAGVAALLLEKHGKQAGGKELWDLLVKGARGLGADHADVGSGIVHVR